MPDAPRCAADPDPRLDQPLVWARAAVVGVLAGTLGVVGHVSADGLLPHPVVVAALIALGVPLAAPALMVQASRLRVASLLVAGQTLIHVVLTATSGHRGDHPGSSAAVATERSASGGVGGGARDLALPTDGRGRVGSLMDAYQASAPSGAGPGAGGSGADPWGAMVDALRDGVAHLVADLGAHAPMMLAHLAAAALLGLWLAGGESALFTLVALTSRATRFWVAVRHRVVAPVRVRCRRSVVVVSLRASHRLDGSTTSRRGPPTASCPLVLAA